MEEQYGGVPGGVLEEEESYEEPEPEPVPTPPGPNDEERRQVENLFAVVAKDRSKAFELKRALDRLGIFKEYEDRFLDLFQKPD